MISNITCPKQDRLLQNTKFAFLIGFCSRFHLISPVLPDIDKHKYDVPNDCLNIYGIKYQNKRTLYIIDHIKIQQRIVHLILFSYLNIIHLPDLRRSKLAYDLVISFCV